MFSQSCHRENAMSGRIEDKLSEVRVCVGMRLSGDDIKIACAATSVEPEVQLRWLLPTNVFLALGGRPTKYALARLLAGTTRRGG